MLGMWHNRCRLNRCRLNRCRLNNCRKWAEINNVGKEKIDFNDIYSNDRIVLNRVIDAIEEVWELKFANGRMKGTQ